MSDAPSGGHATPLSGPPFVSRLRARPEALRLGAADAPVLWAVRVQVAEVWDAVRVIAPPDEPALGVKVAALEALYPDAAYHDDFVMKLGGAEVLDENASLEEVGARDGSIFLVEFRRRRAVR